ncbi:related to monocarboxylate transporter [Cephalotrichum gorgonifer]|uniref:Related to monocarboxylate transporter n=1 Tax=Cephalotrichum gorgonifer TaxID=2041049 RepID=A0AAE8MWU6_9PEZI|nr:related to monocarboxylate transporter [Cephalotrichum gorgonifer]
MAVTDSLSEKSHETEPRDPSAAEANNTPETNKLSPAPDGGLQAWLVAGGAAFIFFSALGYVNSFGVFQQYYMTHQLSDRPADSIAWIGSVSGFLQLGMGGVAGPLFDRYGATGITRPAALGLVVAIMLVSLCKEFWQFILAQGILTGAVMGFLIFPAMGSVSQYFDKKRGAALGLVIAGSSVGGVVFPIALSKMLHETSLGFGWTVRIMGFVMLPCLTFSCLTVKPRLPPRKTSFFITRAFKEPFFLILTLGLFFGFMGMFTPLFFIPAYAVSTGVDPTLASYLVAILNAGSTFGRIIPGILADKFGRLNVLAAAGISTGIVACCLSTVTSTGGLVVYSVAIGFTSGAILSGGSTAFSMTTKNPQELGAYMGMGMALSSIAALIGPPISGALVARYEGYLELSLFSGISCLASGFIVLIVKAITPEGIFGRT